jgi:hypothetical protein
MTDPEIVKHLVALRRRLRRNKVHEWKFANLLLRDHHIDSPIGQLIDEPTLRVKYDHTHAYICDAIRDAGVADSLEDARWQREGSASDLADTMKQYHDDMVRQKIQGHDLRSR